MRSLVAFILFALAAAPGCLERRLYISSDPPGAIVHLNDNEVGRTPVEIDFKYYEQYEVRLNKEGYEPIAEAKNIVPPIQEIPPFDLFAEIIPATFRNEVRWEFTLTPSDPDPDALIDRAREMRERYIPPPVEPAGADDGGG